MNDLSRWPALVLTAGLATRLRPLSDVRAKAAMPVAGIPIVVRILQWLQEAGIREVVLNLHHRPETITALVGDGSDLGLRVRYSWERVVLGSAGGPRRASALLDSPRFLIVNGDTLTDCDIRSVVARHEATGARVTMAVVDGDVERYGGVIVEEGDRVIAFGRPRPHTRAYHFIGVQAVDADVFSSLPDDEPSESVKMLYPQIIAARRDAIRIHHSDAAFLDVGTARDYLATVHAVAKRERRPLDIGSGCRIARDAHLQGSVVWDRVTVGAQATIINSVLADDAHVAPGEVIENAVVTSSGRVPL